MIADKLETSPKLPPDWLGVLSPEFEAPYMHALKAFLVEEKKGGAVVYPRGAEIFNAMTLTPLSAVRVVILGQDPYHGPNQAHGLSFSVRDGVALPPSLQNIYKEIAAEFSIPPPKSGDLSRWAKQGVLLLNATLTVRQGEAGSHQNKGWEAFTDSVIRAVAQDHDSIVFMLWGAYAQKKGAMIDQKRHLVLTAPHPSPLSAHRGFLGCGHFKKANDYLVSKDFASIDWS